MTISTVSKINGEEGLAFESKYGESVTYSGIASEFPKLEV